METKEHFQKLHDTFKKEGALKAVTYDLEETLNRGHVTKFGEVITAGVLIGVIANTLYSGVEALVTEQTFIDSFKNLESVFKHAVISGAIGSQFYYHYFKRD